MPVVFPIAYFGSISYYKDLISCKDIVFELEEHFVKQSIRNRARIMTSNGVMELSIPVIKQNGSKTLTKDVLVSSALGWRKDHWRAIESAYKHAAYFDHYGEEVQALIYQTTPDLVGFDLSIMERLKTWLDIPYSFSCSTTFNSIESKEIDFRLGYTAHSFNMDYYYFQVFQDKIPFVGDLSLLDAIFNLGPMSRKLLIP